MAINTAADYIQQCQQLVADTSGLTFSTQTMLNCINQARTRVGLDTHCYRSYVQNLNTIGAQETYPYNAGAIGGATMVSGGSNYSAATQVTLTGGSGTGATAVASITSGVITNVFMTNWGTGYTPTGLPTISITDTGGGTGASATPVVLYNVLDVLAVDILWGTQRICFDYAPFSVFNTFVRYLQTQRQTPSVFSLHQGDQLMYAGLVPDQAYVMDWDLIRMPTDLTNTNSPETQIVAPWNDAVQFYAAFLLLTALQEFEKASFFYDPKPDGSIGGIYGGRIKQLPATAFCRRVPNPYSTFWPYIKRLR